MTREATPRRCAMYGTSVPLRRSMWRIRAYSIALVNLLVRCSCPLALLFVLLSFAFIAPRSGLSLQISSEWNGCLQAGCADMTHDPVGAVTQKRWLYWSGHVSGLYLGHCLLLFPCIFMIYIGTLQDIGWPLYRT